MGKKGDKTKAAIGPSLYIEDIGMLIDTPEDIAAACDRQGISRIEYLSISLFFKSPLHNNFFIPHSLPASGHDVEDIHGIIVHHKVSVRAFCHGPLDSSQSQHSEIGRAHV